MESVVQLLDDGNTVPFITRYRKEQTGNLNEVVIDEIQLRVQPLARAGRAKGDDPQGDRSAGQARPRPGDRHSRGRQSQTARGPLPSVQAQEAHQGLGRARPRIGATGVSGLDPGRDAHRSGRGGPGFCDADKGVDSVDKVIEGVGHILAEAISEMATVRDAVRRLVWKTGRIVTAKAEIPEGQGLEYRDYFDYSEPVAQIPPHRVLAINRGDKEGPLKVRLDVPRPEAEAALFSQLPLENHPHVEVFRSAAIDSLDRLILPSMEREVRRDLTEAAERHAVEVFAKNLRSLLLQPPIPKQVVMAIDPGFKTGCKARGARL